MDKANKQADFFMGANSPNGFFSFYDELKVPKEGVRSYLIKGGAGTGKSGLMKKLAEEFLKSEELLEYIHCSSDPNSLDGVVLHTAKCSIVDATPPHVIEPAYPGSYETVINLCEFFDEKKMEKRLLDTVLYQTKNNECHHKCRKLIRCAAILLDDNKSFVESCTDFDKVKSTALKLCKTLLPKTDKQPEVRKRLLTAITNQGICCYENTIKNLCTNIIAIDDIYGASANVFLKTVMEYATSMGYSMFCCYSPLDPQGTIENIIIPGLSLGFITKNPISKFEAVKPTKTIHFTRFTDMEAVKKRKQYLKFNKTAADELIQSAIKILVEAKAIHDELEKQYTDAVDFSGVNEKTAKVIKSISDRYK